MTAKGKINASNVQTGNRIIVKVSADGTVRPSDTKTGEGVQVAQVLGKLFRAAQGPYEARGKYVIITSAGTFEAAPIQTMFLAPEDAAGIKRAHVEALELDKVYEAYPLADEEIATPAALVTEMDEAHEATTAGCANFWHATAPARRRMLCPECPAENDWSDETSRKLIEEDHELALAEDLTLHSHDGKVVLNTENDTEEPEMTAQTETTENHTGSTVVALLERVWGRIRENHPELPEVVIITGSGLIGGSKWGHFRADGWKADQERRHELFLAGEALAKGARQVLQTMIHEAAHTISKVRGIQDTSRQGRWHNKEFKKAAEELGLEHKAASADSSHGYSFVTLTERTVEKYADLLEELDREIKLTCHLPLWLGGSADEDDKGGEKITGKAPKGEDEKKTQSGPIKATCNCEEPNIIRASRKVLDKRVISCEDCDSVFRAAD
jgi:hypothetical protein